MVTAAAMLSEYGDINGTYLPLPDRKFSFSEKGADFVAIYLAILRFAHENHIDLRILVSPSHARQWHLVSSIGLWDRWEAWKHMLVKQNEDIATELKRAAFPVWDFSASIASRRSHFRPYVTNKRECAGTGNPHTTSAKPATLS
ncbi:MAG: hypothetical protein IPJ25_13685 [Rhodocyclaceae bacterium]|nr:hypothetical protein [Rhodocyclaceae bacterium]